MIRRFAAHYVFPVNSPPVAKGIIETDETGTIIRLIDPKGALRELEGMVFYNGILCPVFTDVFQKFPPDKLFVHFPQLLAYKHFIPEHKQVFAWIREIALHSPFSLEYLFHLFCFQAAAIAGPEKDTGTLEPGKRPGIVLIDRIDFQRMTLSEDSRMHRVI